MLPIIPALLLLLLHGPSNVERLAREGRLPAALDAMHREIARSSVTADAVHEVAIASLLASTDPHFSRAFYALLNPVTARPEPKSAITAAPRADEIQVRPDLGAPPPSIPEGFSDCRRSRDGPSSIA